MSVQAEVKKKPDAAPPPTKPTNGAPAEAAKSTALDTSRPKTFRELLEENRPKLAEVMPRHLSPDRLVRVTIACVNRTPDLLACTTASLLNAVMQAAQLGVEPTGVLGSAYLVPFNVKVKTKDAKGVELERWEKQAQLIVGYRGLIDLSRRSGQIESIEAHVVHENDRFSCHYGLEPKLDHEPCWSGDPGHVKAVYAVAKLKDGGKQIEVMTRSQVDQIMGGSQSKGKWGPWKDHYEEMARKTVVRRLAKYLPLTPELADAMALDDDADRLAAEAPDLPALPKGTEGLKAIVAQKAAAATVDMQAEQEPAHDPVTGEVREPGSDDGPPDGPTEAIDPTVK